MADAKMTLRKRMFLDMKSGQLPPIDKRRAVAALLSDISVKANVSDADNALCMGAIAAEHYYGGAEKVIRQQPGKSSIETFCGDCGKRINQHHIFCPYCGTRFAKE